MKTSLDPSLSKTAGAMSGVSRFLSKRDRSKDRKHRLHSPHLPGHHDTATNSKTTSTTSIDKSTETLDPDSPADFYGLFVERAKANKDEEAKIKTTRQKLLNSKGVLLKDSQILWALRSKATNGDIELAFHLLSATSDASEGIVTTFDPDVKLKGAVNRHAVTCFLDSTLFAMFSRLDSFEAMLYNTFDDIHKERLAFLLRLWVNLLRSGELITVDITKEIQEALAACGWKDARELHQQDASEAFTFITEKLNLPLLTLKMDIYHTGKQDSDDHRFINERLLEVAIPTLANGENPRDIKLEDCLEEYFNNRIEVKRYLERRNTLQSSKSYDSKSKEMGMSVHVEAVEVDPDSATPLTPISPMPSYSSERPSLRSRDRAMSIIQERYISEKSDLAGSPSDNPKASAGRLRAGSIRKEVLMPAWQFFSLIPWYTDNTPSSDAQVAAHFSSKRPVLGLCLKRYSYTNAGKAIRLDTFVDIPIEIALPHFIQDDTMDDGAPLFGNFKLSLQSVVCHRGNSVSSGHYISLVRYTVPAKGSEQEEITHWLRFDDLANPRVSLVDIHKALNEETPYLLFYQILPVEGDPGNLTAGENPPPAYSDIQVIDSANTGETLVPVSSTEEGPKSETLNSGMNSVDDLRGRTPEMETKRRASAISFSENMPSPRTSLEVGREQTRPIEHKKSGSFNGGLTKTFSRLGLKPKKDSKEELLPEEKYTSRPEPGPEINVVQVPSNDPSEQNISEVPRNKSDASQSRAAEPSHTHALAGTGIGVGRSRSKREKSRTRKLNKAGKSRAEDPDRECVVM